MPYTFLSDEWLDEVKKLASEVDTSDAPAVTVNVVVTGGPQGDRELHLADGSFGSGLKEARADQAHRPLRRRPEHVRQGRPGRRDAGVHGRPDQGRGRHDEAHGHAVGWRRSRSGRRSRPSSARSPPRTDLVTSLEVAPDRGDPDRRPRLVRGELGPRRHVGRVVGPVRPIRLGLPALARPVRSARASARTAPRVEEERSRIGAYAAPSGIGPMMAGPTIADARHRRQIDRFLPRPRHRPGHLVPAVQRAGRRLRPRRHPDHARCATATSGSSTARRCGRRARSTPTLRDPHRPHRTATCPSTRASPTSSSTCTSPASRCGRSREMTGGATFNEVFLTDARVRDADRIGDVDRGWAGRRHDAVPRAQEPRRRLDGRHGRRRRDARHRHRRRRRRRPARPVRRGSATSPLGVGAPAAMGGDGGGGVMRCIKFRPRCSASSSDAARAPGRRPPLHADGDQPVHRRCARRRPPSAARRPGPSSRPAS